MQRGRYAVDTLLILLIRHTYVAVNMPRNHDVCTAYLSYLLRRCDVCVAYPRLLSYLRRISDVCVAHLAYQWRMCYVCAAYVSLLWSMCDVLGIFCGIPREHQMFLTGRGGVQGSFRATLGVASVFIHDILRPGWGAWRCPPPPPRPSVSSSVLIFLQWHLRPLIIVMCKLHEQSEHSRLFS